MRIAALAGISLTCADAQAVAAFYESGLGFARQGSSRVSAACYGVEGHALVLKLSLGAQRIELVQFDVAGAPYPRPTSSHDPWFQHFAVVVSDVEAALQRLRAQVRTLPISRPGPQGSAVWLPASSGGVGAVKLRDPEGHPFELLQFPTETVPDAWRGVPSLSGGIMGIDHSAVVVADSARSIAFYCALGLSVGGRTVNEGPAQAALDDADGVRVEVTALSPPQATPHVELLCYRTPASPPPRLVAPNDVAASRLIFVAESVGGSGSAGIDPDGHRLLFRPAEQAFTAS